VQSKLYDIEMSLRGILRGFGLKVGPTTSPSFAARINHLVDGQTSLEAVAAALLSLHAVALREFKSLEKSVRQISRARRGCSNAICMAGTLFVFWGCRVG
jgi:transposase